MNAMNPESVRRMFLFYPAIFPLILVSLAGYFFTDSVAMLQTVANKPQSSQMAPAKIKEAKRVFKQRCVKCHGSDGTGNTTYGQIVGATNLTDPEWQQRVADRQLVNSIKHGRGQMPAFGEKLTDEQIYSLMSYVRAFGK
jgi:cbb3-type cytochrome c oxidase subunit III